MQLKSKLLASGQEFQIRNPKLEIRNKFKFMEMEKFKTISDQQSSVELASEIATCGGLVLNLAHWPFEFVSGFGFRVSDFVLALAFGSGSTP